MAEPPRQRAEDRLEETLEQLHGSGNLSKTRVYDLRKLVLQIRDEAQTDPLTQLPRRERMERLFEPAVKSAKEYGTPLSVLMIDVDNFKRVNDGPEGYTTQGVHYLGHPAGDALLRDIGEIIRKNMRAGDIALRYGGEEILMGLPFTDVNQHDGKLPFPEKALHVADNLCRRIKRDTGHTVSIGVAAYPTTTAEPHLEKLIEHADRALYAAKRAGKNRYVVYRPEFDASGK